MYNGHFTTFYIFKKTIQGAEHALNDYSTRINMQYKTKYFYFRYNEDNLLVT